jgi:hypothetical protein
MLLSLKDESHPITSNESTSFVSLKKRNRKQLPEPGQELLTPHLRPTTALTRVDMLFQRLWDGCSTATMQTLEEIKSAAVGEYVYMGACM